MTIMSPSENTTNVTIRGVDAEIYQSFSDKVKSSEQNIGEVISTMISSVMNDFDEVFPEPDETEFPRKKISINHMDDLEISLDDLIETSARVSFNHIDRLIFDASVTKDAFLKYVHSINHCGTIEISSSMPKLLAYSKANYCDEINVLGEE
ncbi:MAG: hypothetical protein INQ03_20940 [Candidatus Heimdallarchaeota archaeon]|nr:hypothetical protein [Candidatus Heimdallarchaeota archaeon]